MNIVHAQCSIGFHEPYLQLIQRLLPMMPHPSLDSFFFWNSGSEAVEGAIKMARTVTGRQNVITMQGAYHGRTFGAMAVTKSKTIYSEGFEFHPLMEHTTTNSMLRAQRHADHASSMARMRSPSRTGISSGCPSTRHPRSSRRCA